MVPPRYKINAFRKIDVEAPYHQYENAGHIFYAEFDGDAVKNIAAFEQIVDYAAEKGCGYIAINHPLMRDPVCGYVGTMNPDGTCPRCGRHEFEGVSVEKLLSLSSYAPDPDYAITSEKLEDEDKITNEL